MWVHLQFLSIAGDELKDNTVDLNHLIVNISKLCRRVQMNGPSTERLYISVPRRDRQKPATILSGKYLACVFAKPFNSEDEKYPTALHVSCYRPLSSEFAATHWSALRFHYIRRQLRKSAQCESRVVLTKACSPAAAYRLETLPFFLGEVTRKITN